MVAQVLSPLVYLILITIYVHVGSLLFDKTVKLNHFINCPEYKNKIIVSLEDVHFIQVRKMFYVSTKLVAKRNLLPNQKLLLKTERCKSRENLDSCEPYKDLQLKNVCDLQNSKFQLWTPYLESLQPTPTCPLQKGTYVSHNGSFDAAALSILPLTGWYWRIRAMLYESEINPSAVPALCILGEGEIVNI